MKYVSLKQQKHTLVQNIFVQIARPLLPTAANFMRYTSVNDVCCHKQNVICVLVCRSI